MPSFVTSRRNNDHRLRRGLAETHYPYLLREAIGLLAGYAGRAYGSNDPP
jgi:hypothetical protein